MKTLYLIGGTMGAGKTTACRALQARLPNSVFLDGDWCWNARPFIVNNETKAMVMDHITHLLNGFIRCSVYEHIIFCWVMHTQDIIDTLLSRLCLHGCRVVKVSLVLSEQALRTRLERDVQAGLREQAVIARSVARLPLYAHLNTAFIDVSALTPAQTAEAIARLQPAEAACPPTP